ncbi:MAG: 30S ribosomal protein S12 methylthiotransferase RimO [Bacteroidota bacterium]
MKTRNSGQKVEVITLGCSKNLVDSENIVTQLKGNDIAAYHEHEEDHADVVVINTCGFIDLAKEESVDTILANVERKKAGDIQKVYVTGCLSERYREDLERDIPEVDAYFGTMELPGLLARFDADYKHELIGERKISTLPHYAYMKISEGCNRTCSFCAIPLMRGKHVSRPIEELVREAKELAKRGIKELMLIAQELTYYGLDLYKKRELARLLKELASVEGIEWIRLHYAYPTKFPLDVLDAIATTPEVCNYLDIPLQHANDAVLHRMKRQITQVEMRQLVQEARLRVPNISIRTTMLVGFPGESEEEFADLCDFVREMRFDRLGVFQYSHEEDTTAFQLIDDVASEVKAERANRLMDIQREISLEHNVNLIGTHQRVLIDRKEGGYFVGRTEYDSPEVDNEVLVDANAHFVRIGDFVTLEITGAEEFDLYGRPIQN